MPLKAVLPAASAPAVLTAGSGYAVPPLIIGGRSYPITEMTVERTLALVDLVLGELTRLQTSGILTSETVGGLQRQEWGVIAPFLIRLWRGMPDLFVQVVMLLLGDVHPDHAPHLLGHLTLRNLLALIKGALTVNAVEDLITDFFAIGTLLRGAVARAQPPPTAGPSSPPPPT